ncbi:MAG: DUF4190 domain-containing protein, partial [Planctomycetota bacterium]|nr:DUF4190 domain-containing protein [Planctomycetota bacterium]
MENISHLPDYEGASVSQGRTSAMAITSLVLSCIFCCPLTSITGIVTGAIAFLMTGPRSGVAGRWMAVLAIVIGAAGAMLQTGVGVWGWNAVMVPILTGPQDALRAGMSGNVSGMVSAFNATDKEGNTPEAATAFCAELQRRYGAFESATMNQDAAPSQAPPSAQTFPGEYSLMFAKGKMR